MTTKPFSKSLHDANDPRSREAILRHYHSKGLTGLKENPDKFGIDLITEDGKWGIELERRPKWIGNTDYLYSDVHILSRKTHFFTGNDVMNVVYVILNNEYTRAGYLWKSTIQKYITDDYLKNIKCYVPDEGWRFDDVYGVPSHELGYIDLK